MFNILSDLLYICPLWSNLLIKKWQNENQQYAMPTRLSNNSVENYFKIIKHSIFDKKKSMPSVVSSRLYNRLLLKYFQFYEEFEIMKDKKETIDYESWKKKSNKKNIKGFYYSRINNFAEVDELNEATINAFKTVDIDDIMIKGYSWV